MGWFLNLRGRSPKRARTLEEAQARVERMRRWVRGPFNSAMSFVVQSLFAITGITFLKVFNRTRIYHIDRVKKQEPPYLYVSNHLTMIDDFLLDPYLYGSWAIVRLNVKYFPWHVPEEKNFFLNPIIAWIMQKAQAVPITRGHGAFQPGIMRLRELLQEQAIVHIYPEGTRSRTGDVNRGKPGVGKLAYETKSKVVPVYHEGTQDILPIGKTWPRSGKRVAIIVGEPIDMSDLYAQPEGKQVYQAIADRMVNAIRSLRAELHEKGWGIKDIPSEWLSTEYPETPVPTVSSAQAS